MAVQRCSRSADDSFSPVAMRSLTAHRKNPSCAACHRLTDPVGLTLEVFDVAGRHVRTQKPIAPMAPSVNHERLSDTRSIEKWLRRNCKWTLGRECTPQEKGDLLMYLKGL